MSSISQCHKPSIGPFAGPLARTLLWFARASDAMVRGGDRLSHILEGRRVLRELARADDRMLKDIGLARSDLRNAAAEPLYRDPTELLAGRVREFRTEHRPPPARYY
jgi:uncharacterized protein YjiS (DUF1127 family)